MSVKKYVLKPEQVEAIQWDGSEGSQAEIVTWTRGLASGWFSDHYYIRIDTGNGDSMVALPGDYVVKHSSGRFSVLSEPDFKSRAAESR